MRAIVTLALLYAPLAAAQDEGGFSLTDIDLDSIDLSENSETVVFNGDFSQKTDSLSPGAAVSITHPGGNIIVRCTDTDEVGARITYRVEAIDGPTAERFGTGIRMATNGSGARGSVRVSMPGKPSGVHSYTADLHIQAPYDTNLTVNATRGWVQATNCRGTVKATSSTGGAMVSGPLQGFTVKAAEGDVRVELEPGTQLSQASAATATRGDLVVELPGNQNLRLSARGSSVTSDQLVDGTQTSTNISGNLGTGGPALSLYASGSVTITSP